MHKRGLDRWHILSQQLCPCVTLCRGQRWRLVDISRGYQGDLFSSGRENRKIKHTQHTKEAQVFSSWCFNTCCLSEGVSPSSCQLPSKWASLSLELFRSVSYGCLSHSWLSWSRPGTVTDELRRGGNGAASTYRWCNNICLRVSSWEQRGCVYVQYAYENVGLYFERVQLQSLASSSESLFLSCISHSGQLHLSVNYVLIYVALCPSRSFSIQTHCPWHLCACAPYSGHLAKVIGCCVEGDWHCDDCTKQCTGREHKQKSSPESTLCTAGRTQKESRMRKNTFGTQGRNKETNKKTMVGLAGADISHFRVYLCHLTLSLKHYKFSQPAEQWFPSLNSDLSWLLLYEYSLKCVLQLL